MPDVSPQFRKVIQARIHLILNQPFFGSLALRLRLIEDPSIPTFATDGRSLRFNPAFVDSLIPEEIAGVVCHEVLHCSNGHPWRRSGRDPRTWNVACDYAINPIVKTIPTVSLPANCLINPAFAGQSAEWIFARLPAESQNGTGCGEVEDAPRDGGSDGSTEAEWTVATIQAARAAKNHGTLPAELARLINEIEKPRIDWRAVLRRFIQETARADYSWRMPNRNYLAHGLYLPELYSTACPPFAVAIDTSGSIDDSTLKMFASELSAINA